MRTERICFRFDSRYFSLDSCVWGAFDCMNVCFGLKLYKLGSGVEHHGLCF